MNVHIPYPFDAELEQATLGCLMLDNRNFDAVAAFLLPQHFNDPLHQRIYDAMVRLRKASRDVSPITLRPLFVNDEGIKLLDAGLDYFANLISITPSALSAADYARGVYDLAKRREIMGIGEGLADAAKALPIDESPTSLIEQASAALMDLDVKASSQETITGGVAASIALAKAWSASQAERTPGLSFGLEDLDNAIGGAHPGDMIVLAGRPGMGKSAMAAGIARDVSLRGGGVLYVSCEMTYEQLGRRLLSDHCKDLGYLIPYQALRSGKIDFAMYEVGQRADAALKEMPLIIDDRRKPPLAQIIASAKRAQRRFEAQGRELRLVIVDHLQLVAAPREYKGNRVSEVTEVSGELKALARDLGVPIIACSQLNRELEGRDVKDKRPTLRDLRESGAIEQDADMVLMLYREEYYHLIKRPTDRYSEAFKAWEPGYIACKNKLDVIIAKNREGEPTTITLHCDMSVSAIRKWRGYA